MIINADDENFILLIWLFRKLLQSDKKILYVLENVHIYK
jgi:hypothetical protein